jgi:hypothetical protein
VTVPELLRAAVARLRCRHSFPPHSSGVGGLVDPCRHCRLPWSSRYTISSALREPLAALLDATADEIADYRGEHATAGDLTIGGMPCPVWAAAHALALAILTPTREDA